MFLSTSFSSSSCCYRFLTYILGHKVHVWTWPFLILFKFRFFWVARHLFSIKILLWSSYRCQPNKFLGSPRRPDWGKFSRCQIHTKIQGLMKSHGKGYKMDCGNHWYISVLTMTIGCLQPGASSVVFVWEGYFLDISKPPCDCKHVFEMSVGHLLHARPCF